MLRTSDTCLIDERELYLAKSLCCEKPKEIEIADFYLLHVSKICYDEQAPRKEALENVLSSLNMPGIHFLFLIIGRREKADFYYGIARDLNSGSKPDFAVKDIGDSILMPSIQGNFRGSRVVPLGADERRSVLETVRSMPEVGIIEGVPGANKEDEKYQGIDRLINIMYGDTYCFMVVAKPLDIAAVNEIEENIYKFYDKYSPTAKRSVQTGTGRNKGASDSETNGGGKTESSSGSTTKTNGASSSETHTEAESGGKSESTTKGKSSGGSSSSTSESGTTGKNTGWNKSDAAQKGTTSSDSETIGTSSSTSTSNSRTHTSSEGTSESETTTMEYGNREITDFIKFMDDVVFPRLDYGRGKGVFLTSMCVFAMEKIALQKIKNTVASLYAGERGNKIPLRSFSVSQQAKDAYRSFQLPCGKCDYDGAEDKYYAHFALHHLIKREGVSCLGNWITTNELGMIAGLPQKEVAGLALNEEVEFGLNFQHPASDQDRIELGSLIQNGNELPESPVYLDKSDLDKHIFVAGVTGSGKTTTCQKILRGADMPFLVIEPAKTEYRGMLHADPDLLVFTLGDRKTAPLKMNPFLFYPQESITSRVDLLCACMEAAFDMEAAIPQIIEKAVYRSYEEKGWNVYTNQNIRYAAPFDGSGKAFPTISDVIRNCRAVVEEQGFDERLKNDYIGSINARLQGLINGGKGFLLNSNSSVDFIDLLDRKVVFELDQIRSSTEKSLIMGFILINLSEAIREKYQDGGVLRHITLVEESHRLLSRTMPGDNPGRKQSIEMFTDMLAEIRKYGESLIIVDQIPNKLTPDILKNTNTKIIHRIFASDDKEAVGNTVMLKEEQKDFLSNLPTGRAVYFSTGTDKAVQIQIKSSTDTSEQTPDNAEVRDRAIDYYLERYACGLYQGTEVFSERPSREQFLCLASLDRELIPGWLREFLSHDGSIHSAECRLEIENVKRLMGRNAFLEYLRRYSHRKLQQYISREF